MSHAAIAAALALDEVSAGERLAAFALASFANSEQRAWPSTRVAAARAGLSRSQYLAAREGLANRGLIVVEEPGSGRGSSSLISLTFASTGPWFEAEVNPPLFEAVLSYSPARRSSRLLLAALAALADNDRTVTGVTTEELCGAAGIADSTYRRAQAPLLASGELGAKVPGGGRAKTNQWVLQDPRAGDPRAARTRPGRVAPPRSARPLVAAVDQPAGGADDPPAAAGEPAKGPGLTGVPHTNPPQSRTVSPANPPQSRTDSIVNPPQSRTVPLVNPPQSRTLSAQNGPGLTGVSRVNPPQSRTVSDQTPPGTPPETPPETPPPNAHAGREPKNQRTNYPPNPPQGGSLDRSLTVVESYVNERGRRRQRTRTVDLAELRTRLGQPTAVDAAAWQQMRVLLEATVGQTTFGIWLAPLELIAVEPAGQLVVSGPGPTRAWVSKRYGRILAAAAERLGRQVRLAEEIEQHALALDSTEVPPYGDTAPAPSPRRPHIRHQEVS